MRETYGSGETEECNGRVVYDGESFACSLCDWSWQIADRVLLMHMEESILWRTGELREHTGKHPGRKSKAEGGIYPQRPKGPERGEYEWEVISL